MDGKDNKENQISQKNMELNISQQNQQIKPQENQVEQEIPNAQPDKQDQKNAINPGSQIENDNKSLEENSEDSSDLDLDDVEAAFDTSNEETQKCQDVKDKILKNQDLNALEKLVKEYGVNNVCFEYIVGFNCKRIYAQHTKYKHSEDAIEQGLGNFFCKQCNLVLTSKNRLLKHMRLQHDQKKTKDQLQINNNL